VSKRPPFSQEETLIKNSTFNLFEFQLGNGEAVTAATGPNNQLYLDLQELCWFVGLDEQKELAFWQEQPTLKAGLTALKQYDLTIWLARLDLILLRLSKINPAEATPITALFPLDLPLQITNFLDAAMYAHFFAGHPWLFDWLPNDNPTIEAYQIALAHLNMAREQFIRELLPDVEP
jgi:hypothetical protein